jgi:hypothetical protein
MSAARPHCAAGIRQNGLLTSDHLTFVIPGRASFLARTRNPSHRDPCGSMDSGLAPLRFAPRNDESVVIFA